MTMLTHHQELNENFMLAAQLCDIPKMNNLLMQGAYINYCDDDKYTPLFETVIKGDYEGTKFLLSKGANPNARNYRKETALMFARKPEIIKLLAEFNADPLLKNRDGDTAYELFFANKKIELIKAWFDARLRVPKVTVSLNSNVKGCMTYMKRFEKMLFQAIAKADTKQVKRLVEEIGIDINIDTRPDKVTPLMVAAKTNNASIIKLLLNLGADINAKDYLDRSAIDYALKYRAGAALLELIDYEEEFANAN